MQLKGIRQVHINTSVCTYIVLVVMSHSISNGDAYSINTFNTLHYNWQNSSMAHERHGVSDLANRLLNNLLAACTNSKGIMMTSSNGNIFRVTGHLCGEFTGPRWIPAQRPVTRNFDVFFDLRLNKRLSKQSWGWWFETLSCPLWRHCNDQSSTLLILWDRNALVVYPDKESVMR